MTVIKALILSLPPSPLLFQFFFYFVILHLAPLGKRSVSSVEKRLLLVKIMIYSTVAKWHRVAWQAFCLSEQNTVAMF